MTLSVKFKGNVYQIIYFIELYDSGVNTTR